MNEQQLAPKGPIPITVVTGFLGAGKTSLVNRLIAARCGAERIGVVVNEAGEIGLDGQLLGDVSDDVVEIADGCVCCTSQGELLDALASITHVLRLDTMITVVDALHAIDQLDRHDSPEARQQLQLATHVVVSKIDLADADAVDGVRARVARLNPDAQIIIAPRETLDAELLLDRFSLAADDVTAGRDHHHDRDHLDVEIFSVELAGELDGGRFESWLGALLMLNAPDVFRIKAILALAGEPRRQIVHGVQTYVEQAPGRDWNPGEPRTSRIVVIGKDLESARWRDELARCVTG